jgi:hypothetical protein
MDAAKVARVGYRAALKGRRSATPGLVNRLISILPPCLPSRLTAAVVYKVHNG